MEVGARDSDEDGDRYALPDSMGVGRAALVRAGFVAGGLESVLRGGLAGGGVLHVRALLLGVVPIVRVELRAEAATVFAGAMVRFLSSVDVAGDWQKPDPLEFERGRRLDDFDVSQLNPGWYAVRPGVDYDRGYRSAFAARDVLEDVLVRVLVGPLAVDPACWEDGSGVVRLTLTAEDAGRLAALFGYVLDGIASGGSPG